MTTAAVFDLEATFKPSRVLADWTANRQASRIQAAGENSHTTNLTAGELLEALSIGSHTASGIAVTADNAMRVSAVYACVSLIAGAIATLPLEIYQRTGRDRDIAEHEYWWFLNERADAHMSSAIAWECLIAGNLFYGDGYAELKRSSPYSNRVIGWEPLHPLHVTTFWDRGERWHRVVRRNGSVDIVNDADIIQIPSLGFDGTYSPSPITYAAREAIGVSLAAEQYAGKFFSEGATFDYALKTAMDLKTPQVQSLKESLLARVQQPGQPGKRMPLILTGGLEPANLSITPRDAEIIGLRQFSVEEIARIFRVPPFLIGHTSKTTSWGSGIEQMGMGFVRYTLAHHLIRIAQEFNAKLWPTRARYFVEHDTTAFEKGDTKARFEAYRVGLGRAGERAWITVAEIRRREKLPPDEQLDAAPANPGTAATATTAEPADPPPPSPPPEPDNTDAP